jgi:pilus assembly protein Flp/PilA
MTNDERANLSTKLEHLVRGERGNMTEYIILIGVIALLCLAAFQTFGGAITDKAEEQAEKVGTIGDEGGD